MFFNYYNKTLSFCGRAEEPGIVSIEILRFAQDDKRSFYILHSGNYR